MMEDFVPPVHPNCRCVPALPVTGRTQYGDWIVDGSRIVRAAPSPIVENVFREFDRSALVALAEIARGE